MRIKNLRIEMKWYMVIRENKNEGKWYFNEIKIRAEGNLEKLKLC